MEQVTLTTKNCHRAKTVRLKAHPELGDWAWGFQKGPQGRGLFGVPANIATQGNNEITVTDFNLKDYYVTEWLYEVNMEELYEKGVRAFSMTSHSPEIRALQYIRGYEADLLNDLAEIPSEEQESYISQYKQKVADLFDKHSRVASPMITGPARFPTAKNKKLGDAYDRAVDEFMKWRKSYVQRIARRIEASKSPEEKADKAWLSLKQDIALSAGTIKSIDDGTNRGSIRSLFVNSIYGKVERFALKGDVEMVKRATQFVTELNAKLPKPVFTSRHKFWKLVEVAEQFKERLEVRSNREDVEIPFDGGKVVKNFSDDRLQIYHDEKPSRDVISQLKTNGFRWSPSNGCWQRQLTDNAYYSAARVLSSGATDEKRLEWIETLRTAK